MDRNGIIGLGLILAIFLGWSYYTTPSTEEIAKKKAEQASLEKNKTTISPTNTAPAVPQKLDSAALSQNFGILQATATGEDKEVSIENDFLKVYATTKGGRISKVELKKYKTHKDYVANNGKALELFHKQTSNFSMVLPIQNRMLNTADLFFEPIINGTTLTMRLKADSAKYFDFVYKLQPSSYYVDMDIQWQAMKGLIDDRTPEIAAKWSMKAPTQEKSIKNEQMNSGIKYKAVEEKVSSFDAGDDGREAVAKSVKWVAFKQHFFSAILIAKDRFTGTTYLKDETLTENKEYIKDFEANMAIPYNPAASFGLQFYFGPNDYKILSASEQGFEDIIDLGWFGFITKAVIMPLFNFLGGLNWNYGIIILILVLLVKVVLYPLQRSQYLSMAKMRVLKPEIDAITAQFPNQEDAMKKQQATMGLYKSAGASPFGGCFPLLLQIPVLFCMFRFFAGAMQLRQESFLWAEDLSSYDSIYNFPNGFSLPFYGDHVSLFALLMTVSTIVYTKLNNQMSSAMTNPDDPQQKAMQMMMYVMPVIFLGMLNDYAAGLSYYYLLANVLSFVQQWAFRKFIDEGKLRSEIEATKLKNAAQAASVAQKEPNAFQKKLQSAMNNQQQSTKNNKKK